MCVCVFGFGRKNGDGIVVCHLCLRALFKIQNQIKASQNIPCSLSFLGY